MKVTREQMKELEAIGKKLWKKGYDESEIEEYCDIEGYIQNSQYTEEGYYIWLGWSDAREDFAELDKYYATEEEEAEFEQMMAEDEQKQLDEESEPDYSGWAKWHYKA
jgi:hypothetical protein